MNGINDDEHFTSTIERFIRWEQRTSREQKNGKSSADVCIEEFKDYRLHVSQILHDLKSPITGSNRLVEMLLKESLGPLNGDIKSLLSQIKSSNSQMLYLIEKVSELEQFGDLIENISFETIEIEKSLRDCVDEYRPVFDSRSINCVLDVSIGKIKILAHSLSLYRLWHNLLSNAFKFTPEGGLVKVELFRSNHWVGVRVSNYGSKIPQTEQQNLFKRFKQGKSGKRSRSGSGLGLYICHQIVSMHGGEILLDKTFNDGTSFAVLLPILE